MSDEIELLEVERDQSLEDSAATLRALAGLLEPPGDKLTVAIGGESTTPPAAEEEAELELELIKEDDGFGLEIEIEWEAVESEEADEEESEEEGEKAEEEEEKKRVRKKVRKRRRSRKRAAEEKRTRERKGTDGSSRGGWRHWRLRWRGDEQTNCYFSASGGSVVVRVVPAQSVESVVEQASAGERDQRSDPDEQFDGRRAGADVEGGELDGRQLDLRLVFDNRPEEKSGVLGTTVYDHLCGIECEMRRPADCDGQPRPVTSGERQRRDECEHRVCDCVVLVDHPERPERFVDKIRQCRANDHRHHREPQHHRQQVPCHGVCRIQHII